MFILSFLILQQDNEEAAGFMEIEGATVEQAYKKTWKKFSFEIATKEKSLFLYADTAEDADGT